MTAKRKGLAVSSSRKAHASRALGRPEKKTNRSSDAAAPDGIVNLLDERDADGPVWLPPTDFLRWLEIKGVTLSRKSLYKTYLGAGARHPVHTSPDGKRIHKHKALELIRIVQGCDAAGDAARIITERQQADARFRTAKARQAELELEEMEGRRVPIETIDRVWATMWENVRNESRTLEHNLPEELHGKTKAEMRTSISLALHRMFAHLATSCREQVKAAATARKQVA